MARLAVFHPDTAQVYVCTEQKHPKDPQFLAYQLPNGHWLGVNTDGSVLETAECGSYQAFTKMLDLPYLLADRTAFHGGCYRLGYGDVPAVTGPVA